jgi:hypothetical protein
MPEQPNQSAGQEDAQFDRNVLDLMFTEHPWPWTVSEIAREMSNEGGAEDAVNRLATVACCIGSGSSCSRRALRAGPPKSRSARSDRRSQQRRAARTGRGAFLSDRQWHLCDLWQPRRAAMRPSSTSGCRYAAPSRWRHCRPMRDVASLAV